MKLLVFAYFFIAIFFTEGATILSVIYQPTKVNIIVDAIINHQLLVTATT